MQYTHYLLQFFKKTRTVLCKKKNNQKNQGQQKRRAACRSISFGRQRVVIRVGRWRSTELKGGHTEAFFRFYCDNRPGCGAAFPCPAWQRLQKKGLQGCAFNTSDLSARKATHHTRVGLSTRLQKLTLCRPFNFFSFRLLVYLGIFYYY